jgi:GT2 family glycosyltransferase
MIKKNPLISVVMLNYNGLNYLKETIPPILNLDYKNYEIIVVDNGSNDGSIEFIKMFEGIKLIENDRNLGYSQGKNIGIKKSKGEYILLMDNDILVPKKNLLSHLMKWMNKEICFLQPVFLEPPLYMQKTYYYGMFSSIYGKNQDLPVVDLNKIIKTNNLIEIMAPNGACYFFKKSKFVKLGFFDESQPYNIDCFDVGIRAWLFGYCNKLVPSSTVVHLGYKNAYSVKDYAWRTKFLFSGNGRILLKNYSLRKLVFTFPVFVIFQFFKAINYSIRKKIFRFFLLFFGQLVFFYGIYQILLNNVIKYNPKESLSKMSS